jgi:hypothetical protein
MASTHKNVINGPSQRSLADAKTHSLNPPTSPGTSFTINSANFFPLPVFQSLHPEGNHKVGISVNSHIVEETKEAITTTTVMTVVTTITKATNAFVKPEKYMNSENSSALDIKTEDEEQFQEEDQAKSQEDEEDESQDKDAVFKLISIPSEKPSEQGGMFICLHCEKSQPISIVLMSTCAFCAHKRRLCKKCKRSRPAADLQWKGKEHNECSACCLCVESLR